MLKSRILLTGGSGLLAHYLRGEFDFDAPPSSVLDITKFETIKGQYDLIIHCAAYTDVVKAEKEPSKCFNVNVIGTLNMLNAFPGVPFVYISSEYANNPVNFYSWTKLAGELSVIASRRRHLIIRTLFKPVPFPFDKAFGDQWTQGDEITIIAPLIAGAIIAWNDIWMRRSSETIYIGTGRKRIIDIARKSNPNVGECSVDDIKDVVLPKDY